MMCRILQLVLIFTMFCLGHTFKVEAIDNAFTTWWRGYQTLPTIKVLIVHDQPGAVLEVKGKYKLFDPHSSTYLSTRFIGKRKFIQPLSEGLKWGEEFPGIHQIKIVPDDLRTTTLVDGVEYKGSIYIYDIGGTISVVNEVPLDDYLKVLLTPQFEQKLPAEVAAAVTIAARTNAWYQAQSSPNGYWAVEASRVGYLGNAAVLNNGIAEAIDQTRNMVMKKNGQTFPAEWGSAAGGAIGGSKPIFSRITLFDAEDLAKKGQRADKILSQAFPDAIVTLIE